MENSCEENAKNDMLRKMHQMMRHVKSDEKLQSIYDEVKGVKQ